MTTLETSPSARIWRPLPGVIVICGCLVALLAFGPRSALGFFLAPMSQENGWGRDVFSLALAMQNLLWGAAQPFAGAFADRYGAFRVISGGAILYVLGLLLMAFSRSPAMLDLSAGVLIGFGLAGCSFTIVLAAFGKLLPEGWRSLAFGAGTAAGSFGQFLFSPLAVGLKDAFGWQGALAVFAALCLTMLPLSLALATPRSVTAPGAAPSQTLTQALSEALSHRSYLLLVLGYFTCGFQLAFITIHLPAYLVDKGLPASVGGWTIGVIGLFNIIGSLGCPSATSSRSSI
jgi:MFS family permease